MIVSCLLAGIDPYNYFVDLLQRIRQSGTVHTFKEETCR
ncbi:hypothetical protein [Endozoicomonas sp. ALD040]